MASDELIIKNKKYNPAMYNDLCDDVFTCFIIRVCSMVKWKLGRITIYTIHSPICLKIPIHPWLKYLTSNICPMVLVPNLGSSRNKRFCKFKRAISFSEPCVSREAKRHLDICWNKLSYNKPNYLNDQDLIKINY